MGPVVQVASPGVVLAVAALVGGAALLAAFVLARSAHRRRAALDAALARSRDEVESLGRRVEELSAEVVRARRAGELDREYVITSIVDDQAANQLAPGAAAAQEPNRPLARDLEDQLVQALARQPRTSPLRARAVELVVRTVSLGHGVRRALSADVLDRAAAESHVARRRSRRDRRRQVRQARRLVRTDPVRGQEVA